MSTTAVNMPDRASSLKNQQSSRRRVDQHDNNNSLVENLQASSGLLSRKKCILIVGDADSKSFSQVYTKCKGMLKDVSHLVECKVESLSQITNEGIPPQRNIAHAVVLLDASKFIGGGKEHIITTVKALDNFYKSKLPTNSNPLMSLVRN